MVPLSVWSAWISVSALGKQWRIDAALLPDHELVRKGPYRLLRHPVYTSYFTMVLANALLLTSGPVIACSAALFAIGTEVRVRAEDELLSERFGEEFETYRRRVRAYLPLVR
jgi:protein-S-isoprenylcysteine O-methyltransferase Ste14